MSSTPPTDPPPRRSKWRRIFRILSTLITLLILATPVALYYFRDHLLLPSTSSTSTSSTSAVAEPQPDPERYAMLIEDLDIRRARLAQRYREANSESQRQSVLTESQQLLEAMLPELMRCWLGTRWEFHGTSETPGEGAIACGYYVSTILRDAGFKMERYKLSRQASQTILRAFVPKQNTHIRVGMDYDAFHDEITNQPEGIYIVGLDRHVGFIVHDGGELRFIHSSGGNTKKVVDEAKHQAAALMYSNYRVYGNLTREEETLKRWLLGQTVYPRDTPSS